MNQVSFLIQTALLSELVAYSIDSQKHSTANTIHCTEHQQAEWVHSQLSNQMIWTACGQSFVANFYLISHGHSPEVAQYPTTFTPEREALDHFRDLQVAPELGLLDGEMSCFTMDPHIQVNCAQPILL